MAPDWAESRTRTTTTGSQIEAAVAAMNLRPGTDAHVWEDGGHTEVKDYINSLDGCPARANYRASLDKIKSRYDRILRKKAALEADP